MGSFQGKTFLETNRSNLEVFSLFQDSIYLLQSRPITTLNAFSNWELLHELDSPIMSEDEHSSFANVGEVSVKLCRESSVEKQNYILSILRHYASICRLMGAR